MAKITDFDFSLSHVFAINPKKKLTSGVTFPYLIFGKNEHTHLVGEYVLKPFSFPQMSIQSSLFELLASFIAMELDLKVPEPVLINISPEFTELIDDTDDYQNMKNSIGVNFGSVFIKGGFETWQMNQTINKKMLLDMFIQNVDRNKRKPNILTNGLDIYIIDHEKAFTDTVSILPVSELWKFSIDDINNIV